MVTVKYSTERDEISLATMSQENDLVERKWIGCGNSCSSISKRKLLGTILYELCGILYAAYNILHNLLIKCKKGTFFLFVFVIVGVVVSQKYRNINASVDHGRYQAIEH